MKPDREWPLQLLWCEASSWFYDGRGLVRDLGSMTLGQAEKFCYLNAVNLMVNRTEIKVTESLRCRRASSTVANTFPL